MALSGSFYNYPTGSFGLYCEWSGSQSATGNYTDVTLKVYLSYYTISVGARADSTVSINGTSETYTVPAISDMSSTSYKKVLLKTYTVRVSHNSNGTKTGVELKATWRFSGTYSGVSIGTITAKTTVDLDTIDRAAPTVSCSTSVVSSSSLTVTATASTTCDVWEYSLDNGSTWTQFSTTSATSQSKTLTGLTSKSYSIKVRARKKSNQVKGTSGTSTCDIVAPTLTFTNSNITANSVYINASSSVTCDIWQYSTNGGTSWTQFSTTAGTSAAKTITGLSPNVTYNIKVRARKKSNGLYGTSAGTNITTLGGSVLNSVSALTVDATSPVLSLNWTVYDANYTHTLVIKNGSTSVLTITGLTGSKGTNNKTYAFTAAQRTSILNAMSALASFTATFVLTTYSGSSQVGDASSITATIQTTAANSAPTFTGFTFKDNLAKTVAVTENNQLFIKAYSQLLVTCTAATAKNGATIARYTATIGTVSKSSTTTSISYGSIASSGNLTLTVTATDSRGYTASRSMTITVIDYTDITIDSWMMRRVNEVEAQTQLTFAGKLSSVSVDGTAMNTLQSVQYRYKQTTATSWSSWYTIGDVEETYGGFSYESTAFITLDARYSYNVQIKATDELSTHTIGFVLNKGTPLMAYRSQKVGINNVDPQSALDVIGEIMMNGFNVMGFVSALGSTEELDEILDLGIYTQSLNVNASTDRGYPVAKAGYLEVLGNPSGYRLHRYTAYDCSGIYVRYYYQDSWSSWKTITLS